MSAMMDPRLQEVEHRLRPIILSGLPRPMQNMVVNAGCLRVCHSFFQYLSKLDHARALTESRH